MYAKIHTGIMNGLELIKIVVEVSILPGLPSFSIVGLPTNTVSEARLRVQAALSSKGFEFPNRKIVVNLAPAHIRKDSTLLDLPIAFGLLCAALSRPNLIEPNFLYVGELSLAGAVSASPQALALTLGARHEGFKAIVLAQDDATTCAHIDGIDVFGIECLGELVLMSSGQVEKETAQRKPLQQYREDKVDFADITGMNHAKRAAMIAAVGLHNILLSGPPGCGKSMLGKRIQTILPNLTLEEAMELAAIEGPSSSRLLAGQLETCPPCRSPHYSVTTAGLVGGGRTPKPGEISLAHRGVLFLDEFLEFKRPQLEALRTPMEDGQVTLSRVEGKTTFPAKCLIVGAYNPCPCGFYGTFAGDCSCTSEERRRYTSKLSGPLFDRFELHARIEPRSPSQLQKSDRLQASTSAACRKMVERARNFHRLERATKGTRLSPCAVNFLEEMEANALYSFRRRRRLIDVAESIANLEVSLELKAAHLAEAYHYAKPSKRDTPRKGFGS